MWTEEELSRFACQTSDAKVRWQRGSDGALYATRGMDTLVLRRRADGAITLTDVDGTEFAVERFDADVSPDANSALVALWAAAAAAAS